MSVCKKHELVDCENLWIKVLKFNAHSLEYISNFDTRLLFSTLVSNSEGRDPTIWGTSKKLYSEDPHGELNWWLMGLPRFRSPVLLWTAKGMLSHNICVEDNGRTCYQSKQESNSSYNLFTKWSEVRNTFNFTQGAKKDSVFLWRNSISQWCLIVQCTTSQIT